MDTSPPDQEKLAALLVEHAHRYPEKATLTVTGDRGKPLRLPILLGNPSGACHMPAGVKPSPAWASFVRGVLTRAEAPTIASQIAADCVLHPAPAEWRGWCARWPGLATSLADSVLLKKLGIRSLEELEDDEEPPATLLAVLEATPAAAWRRAQMGQAVYDLVIEPPPAPAWKFFQEAIERPKSDAWAKIRELAEAQVKACVTEAGVVVPVAEIYDRWPGLAVRTIGVLQNLVGRSAEIEIGDW